MTVLTSARRILPLLVTTLVLTFAMAATAPTLLAQADKDAAEKYNEGLGLLKEKDYKGALTVFLEAKDVAEAAGDKGTASKAENYAYRLTYNVGLQEMKAGNMEGALQYFEDGIAMEPSYYKNYKGRASVLKSMGQDEAAMEAFVKTSEVATESGELEERSKAMTQAEGFVAQAMAKEDFDAVIATGSKFLEFSETANVHFYLSHAYNMQGDYEQAIAHADKALELDQGSRASKARIHFEKAEAFRNTGRYDAALQSYAEAAYGDFKQRAEYMIEELSGSN